MDVRKALLEALEADPLDDVTRLVYADFLEENDEIEEAHRMRAWRRSYDWMVRLAEEAGETCDNYASTGDEVFRPVTVQEVIDAGTVYEETSRDKEWGGERFTQQGSERLRNLFQRWADEDEGDFRPTPREYWDHWEVVTGGRRPAGNEYEPEPPAPFSCSC